MPEPITLASAAPIVAKLAAELAAPTKGLALSAKQKLEIRFRKGFEKYIEKQLGRASTVKTIISSSTPIALLDFYVNLFLANGKSAFRDEDFVKEIATYKHVIFTATAGAGKSMLMRYLYLRFLDSQHQRLPVFVDLRDLNHNPDKSLLSFIHERIADHIEGFSEQHLKYAIERGSLVLFLDGFDEVNHDARKIRERELHELAAKHEELWTFVSSRPAETFANWEKFHVFNVQPFTKKQVELLIEKIPYDEEIKQIFKKKLDQGLYETHEEFLTNPLLTIMMLVTLEQFAEVPAKIHLFYEYAFEALFGRHDVTKGGFQRKKHTALALDDFKRLFSYFCMITYIKKSISFSGDALLNHIQQSISSSQIVVNKIDFKNDLTESTCMLVMDGLDYTFSHRSFQEYFSAYFLARVKVDEIARVVPKLVQIEESFDNVLKMLSEMNSEKFEEAWSLPTLERMCKSVEGIDANQNPIKFHRALIGEPSLYFVGGGHITLHSVSNPRDNDRFAVYHVYDFFDQVHSSLKKERAANEKFLEKVKLGTALANDSRFDQIRLSLHDGKVARSTKIALTDADDVWVRELYIGKFLATEAKLLPQLKEQVAARVTARRKGLAAIFS